MKTMHEECDGEVVVIQTVTVKLQCKGCGKSRDLYNLNAPELKTLKVDSFKVQAH